MLGCGGYILSCGGYMRFLRKIRLTQLCVELGVAIKAALYESLCNIEYGLCCDAR